MSALLQTDGYKLFHKEGYHQDITEVYSNYTSRNGRLSNTLSDEGVVFVGLQYFIKDVLIKEWNDTFFNIPKEQAVKAFKRIVDSYLSIDYDASHFEALHDLGYLPLRIKALAEGSIVPYGVAPVTFVSTVSGFQWLPNYIETVMSTENWPIQTATTTALAYYKRCKEALELTGGVSMAKFNIHDFSFRGLPGRHAAAMIGFGHLASGLAGTDNLSAILFAEKFYGADVEKELVGCSVPATEHSTATSYIMIESEKQGISLFEAELQYVKYLFTKAPTGILSHVSDSFDFWSFVEKGLVELKDDIMNREGTFVVRPDSGCPVEVLCGLQVKYLSGNWDDSEETFNDWKECVADAMDDQFRCNLEPEDPHGIETETYSFGGTIYEVTYEPTLDRHDKQYYYVDNDGDDVDHCTFKEVTLTAEQKGLIQCLWEIFGGTTTDKGFKQLDRHIGAIYGDAITLGRQDEIYKRLMDKGFVPSVVLGVGSYSYQMVTRDTHGSAVKATNVVQQGIDVAVFKDPKTDSKKKSAKGLLRIEREHGELVQYDMQTREQEEAGLLQVVFENGKLYNKQTLKGIRDLVASQM
jgi:nicotinamide phosphoribosyltransferase